MDETEPEIESTWLLRMGHVITSMEHLQHCDNAIEHLNIHICHFTAQLETCELPYSFDSAQWLAMERDSAVSVSGQIFKDLMRSL